MDEALVKQLKQRVEDELRQRETAILDFWFKELKSIDALRRQILSAREDLSFLIP